MIILSDFDSYVRDAILYSLGPQIVIPDFSIQIVRQPPIVPVGSVLNIEIVGGVEPRIEVDHNRQYWGQTRSGLIVPGRLVEGMWRSRLFNNYWDYVNQAFGYQDSIVRTLSYTIDSDRFRQEYECDYSNFDNESLRQTALPYAVRVGAVNDGESALRYFGWSFDTEPHPRAAILFDENHPEGEAAIFSSEQTRRNLEHLHQMSELFGQLAESNTTTAVSSVPPDASKVLIEFARSGNKEDFDWTAQSYGVQKCQLQEMWEGTRKRLHLPVSEVIDNEFSV